MCFENIKHVTQLDYHTYMQTAWQENSIKKSEAM